MEKRSRRRTRDLVTQPAFQGLSENKIGCARISMMARSTSAPFKGRIQNRKTYHFHSSNLTCNARPVHTEGSFSTQLFNNMRPRPSAVPREPTFGSSASFVVKGQQATSPSIYSITLSARASNVGGTIRPSASALLRLITSSNLVGCSTGISATLTPRKSCTSCRA